MLHLVALMDDNVGIVELHLWKVILEKRLGGVLNVAFWSSLRNFFLDLVKHVKWSQKHTHRLQGLLCEMIMESWIDTFLWDMKFLVLKFEHLIAFDLGFTFDFQCVFISDFCFFFFKLCNDRNYFCIISTDWLCTRNHQLGSRLMMKFKMELFLPIL